MACEFYFNISRAAVELMVIALIAGATVYVVKDLMEEEEETDAVIDPVEG